MSYRGADGLTKPTRQPLDPAAASVAATWSRQFFDLVKAFDGDAAGR